MAGGKETPRQKMIGMMYLVLTALLALNVSKSILDAFVAIEENIQKANLTELFRGDEKKAELAETIADKSNPQRSKKAEVLMKAINEIDDMTAKRIKMIDDLKLEILTATGEEVTTVAPDHAIIREKYDANKNPLKPTRMNLEFVNGKDKYDDPMRIMIGEATDIKRPAGKGIDLWKSLNDFRKELTERIASSQVVVADNGSVKFDTRYSFKASNINEFKDQKDLDTKIKKSVDAANVHPDDRAAIIEIYRGLTKEELSEVHGMSGVHWIGKTFDHSPSVAAIASLSSLQKDVLAARAQAVALIRGRVGGGEYSFNKIIPLAYGPEVVNANEEFTVEVLMAAYDSDKQPEVTYNGTEVTEVKEGKGYVKVKASGSKMDLKGTVSIRNKSGIRKTLDWTKEVVVMKPAGSIELPELNVLYRGYPNKVDPTASGFPETVLSGSNASISRSGDVYIVKPGGGKSATLTVSGKSKDGKSASLKTVTYRVSNLPDPELYWGAAKNGSRGSKAETKLFAKYPPEIPLNASFSIISWECQVPGAAGRPPSGTGNNISAASNLLRAVKPGSQVSFICKVKGPDGIIRTRAGAFKI